MKASSSGEGGEGEQHAKGASGGVVERWGRFAAAASHMQQQQQQQCAAMDNETSTAAASSATTTGAMQAPPASHDVAPFVAAAASEMDVD